MIELDVPKRLNQIVSQQMNITEAHKMALAAIRAQKLRSMLTLIGIIAGVASIIAVMTGISVIQNTMEKEMSVLGTTTFQVQKWPAGGFNRDVDWRKIQRRKPVTVAVVFRILTPDGRGARTVSGWVGIHADMG